MAQRVDPSPVAVLFLIAVNPRSGRLVRRHRLRFRKALAKAHAASGPFAATRARRAAVVELRSAGLIEKSRLSRRYSLIAGSGATRPFGQLRHGIDAGFESSLDRDLFVLLAWSGVLATRLSRSERTSARRRLTRMMKAPSAALTSPTPVDAITSALGQVVYRQEVHEVQSFVHALLTADGFPFDLPSAYVGNDAGHHDQGVSTGGYSGDSGGDGGGSAHAGP